MEKEVLTIVKNRVSKCDKDAIEVVIPEGVTKINKSAFAKCRKLEKVVLPDSMIELEEEVFANCRALKEVVFGKNLKVINLNAFPSCYPLDNITLPESIEVVKGFVGGCKFLKKLYIPKNVKTIFESFTVDCENLESIEVDKDNKTYDSRDNCNCIIESATNEIKVFCKNSTIPLSVKSMSDKLEFKYAKNILAPYIAKYEQDTLITHEFEHSFNVILKPLLDCLVIKIKVVDQFQPICETLKIELSNDKKMMSFNNFNHIDNQTLRRVYFRFGSPYGRYPVHKMYQEDTDEEERYVVENVVNNKEDETTMIRNRFTPPPKVMLGHYDYTENKVVLYIKSILEEAQKFHLDFTDYTFSVLAHEIFHAYHAEEYSKANDWTKDSPNHSLIIESLASYAQFMFVKNELKNTAIKKHIESSWTEYSMLVYPYAGAQTIDFEESERKYYERPTYDTIDLLCKSKTRNLGILGEELWENKRNYNCTVNFFNSLLNLSLHSLKSAEKELMNIAIRYGTLL